MILTAITFFIILTVLVLIHELGHFLIARLVGVHVEEFGLGLPPRIWGKKIGRTIYSINTLPIGGFVRLAGEDAEEGEKKAAKGMKTGEYFWARSKTERSAILAAGVVMNFILAVAITGVLLVSGVKEPTGRVHVERVIPGSPAAEAGFMEGDLILELEAIDTAKTGDTPSEGTVGRKVVPKTPGDLISYIGNNKGREVMITRKRGETVEAVTVVPRVEVPRGEGPLGIAISDLEVRKYSVSEAPAKAFAINVTRAKDMFVSIVDMLWKLVTFQKLSADVAGPIGIAQVTGQAVKFGWAAVLEFASILSLNLAVLNILPIPALDGGRLAFVFLEKILGKRVRPAFEKSTHQIGMLILLGLVFLVSIHDILRIIRGG